MGSSAGGHLTLMGVTSSKRRAYWPIDELDKIPCNVQWAVAIYPAYALTDGSEKGNATGGNDDSARPVPEFSFDLATCPVLFVHGDADGWAAMNSVKCWEQLRRTRRAAHAGHAPALLPEEGGAWHRQLHLSRPHLGVLEPQGLQRALNWTELLC